MKNKNLIIGAISGVVVLAAIGVYLDAKKVKDNKEEQSKIDEIEAIELAEKRYEKSLSTIEEKYSRYYSLSREADVESSHMFRSDLLSSIDYTYKRRIEKIKQAKENGEDADSLCRRLSELEEYIDMTFRNISEIITANSL